MSTMPPAGLQRVGPSWWRVIGWSAVLPCLLLLLAAWLLHESRSGAAVRAQAQRAVDQQDKVNDLMALVMSAEAGQRRYILTGDGTFLRPYLDAKRQLGPRIRALARSMGEDAERQARAAGLIDLVARKFAEMDGVLATRERAGTGAAIRLIGAGEGRRSMERIREIGERINLDGRRRFDHAARTRAAQIRRSEIAVWWLLVLMILFASAAGYVIGSAARSRSRFALRHEDAAARRKAIFDHTTDGMIIINPSGSIEKINPAAEKMFGYEADELLCRDITTLLDFAKGEGTFLERLGMGDGALERSAFLGLTGTCKNGRSLTVDVVLGTMPLPDGVHIIASCRDASEREEVERMKDEFISTVSHELRTPLTSVLGSLNLLRAGAAGTLPPQAQRLAVIAENNCQRLIRLINDILDIDKIQAGTMQFQYREADLRDVAAGAAEAMQGLAEQNQISVACELPEQPVMITADSERLVQVAANLISNAVRYSPQGGTVLIEISRNEHSGILTVKDSGPGISEEVGKQIFRRFYQGLKPSKDVVTGSGLGLAISREIVGSHGGEIGFENRPEGGASFFFTIPLQHVAPAAPGGGDKVLICEDDPDAASTIQALLASQGVGSDIVGSVRDARQAALGGGYSALVLDLRLPDGSGLDVIRAVRASRTAATLPIIIASGSGPGEAVAGPASIGIIDWIEKPIDHPRLVRAVETALAKFDDDQRVVLHVEDDPDTLEILATAIGSRARVIGVRNLESARAFLKHRQPDVVILDLGLPDGHGASLLPDLVDKSGKALPIIIYSAQDVDGVLQKSVDAALTKSRRTLPSLVSAISQILEGGEGGRA